MWIHFVELVLVEFHGGLFCQKNVNIRRIFVEHSSNISHLHQRIVASVTYIRRIFVGYVEYSSKLANILRIFVESSSKLCRIYIEYFRMCEYLSICRTCVKCSNICRICRIFVEKKTVIERKSCP